MAAAVAVGAAEGVDSAPGLAVPTSKDMVGLTEGEGVAALVWEGEALTEGLTVHDSEASGERDGVCSGVGARRRASAWASPASRCPRRWRGGAPWRRPPCRCQARRWWA